MHKDLKRREKEERKKKEKKTDGWRYSRGS
jgi:hypothetical protein